MTKKTAKKQSGKVSAAGRPVGTGKFGCKTKVIRVPVCLVEEIFEFINQKINRT